MFVDLVCIYVKSFVKRTCAKRSVRMSDKYQSCVTPPPLSCYPAPHQWLSAEAKLGAGFENLIVGSQDCGVVYEGKTTTFLQ